MMASLYAASKWPVRPEIGEAHAKALLHLAAPGTWWSGAERLALAEEARASRDCALCNERKRSLSPAAVTGEHDAPSGAALPAAAVDVAHRVASDPGRLSRKWFEGVVAAGVSDAHYVEAVAITARTVSTDSFCRGVGVPPHPLPAPVAGEPKRSRPPGARGGEAWVPMIAPEDASGEEANLYGGAKHAPNIARALSLVPAEVRAVREISHVLYVPLDRVPDFSWSPPGRALSRPQMELVAARVSALNQCFY
jgi:hypothetical protein